MSLLGKRRVSRKDVEDQLAVSRTTLANIARALKKKDDLLEDYRLAEEQRTEDQRSDGEKT